jgi:MFS family permease
MPFTLGIVMLGLSAALFGTAVERRGPRWAMFVATACFAGGLLVAAAAAELGQMWLIILGYGVVGGIGLGIGYISPVSTLMKWFPDRPGMATGFAIMGFGGGALIASPWSSQLMKWFGTDRHGLALTFLVMGLVYAVFMSVGVLLVRVPPHEWDPPIVRVASSKLPHAAGPDRTANEAVKTPQFWLLWIVLCFNVTAGIGILERAAPIYRDYFPHAASPAALTAAAAGFVAMLSLANSLGRILWSTASDAAGRKNMYRLYLGVGALLYVVLIVAQNASKPLFLVVCILLLSFYGAGFATVPAYLRDLFGYLEVGAIHGRLLTAWSTAGVLGPVIVNAIADNRIAAHVVGPERYRWSFMIMVVLLLIGVICNELIRTPRPPSFVVPAVDTRKAASVVSGEDGQ